MVGHAGALDLADELVPILLARFLQKLRMRLSDDQVESARVTLHDLGHRRDHVLETLPRIDEAEGRQDRAVFDAELALQPVPPTRDDRGHAVLDHHRPLRDPVHVLEQPRRGLGHDDHPRAVLSDAPHGFADLRLGLGKNRVQGRDDRLLEGFEERHAMILVDAVAPDTV